mmetsp:Transcript_12388/g.30358  ORF Transcript_12388/g.30358 Transcript_12388/m.30358 type:complete len:327 (+) Transcript_12388:317-1297(+)
MDWEQSRKQSNESVLHWGLVPNPARARLVPDTNTLPGRPNCHRVVVEPGSSKANGAAGERNVWEHGHFDVVCALREVQEGVEGVVQQVNDDADAHVPRGVGEHEEAKGHDVVEEHLPEVLLLLARYQPQEPADNPRRLHDVQVLRLGHDVVGRQALDRLHPAVAHYILPAIGPQPLVLPEDHKAERERDAVVAQLKEGGREPRRLAALEPQTLAKGSPSGLHDHAGEVHACRDGHEEQQEVGNILGRPDGLRFLVVRGGDFALGDAEGVRHELNHVHAQRCLRRHFPSPARPLSPASGLLRALEPRVDSRGVDPRALARVPAEGIG